MNGGNLFYYRPPILNRQILKKLEKLEKIGSKAWPFLGGGYTVVAVKRVVIPLTPIRAPWKAKQKVWIEEGLSKPAPKVIVKEEINER